MPAASESRTISPIGDSASAEAETPAPGNLARKNTHADLCLAGDTPGVFTNSGKGFGIFGKKTERSRTEDTEVWEGWRWSCRLSVDSAASVQVY